MKRLLFKFLDQRQVIQHFLNCFIIMGPAFRLHDIETSVRYKISTLIKYQSLIGFANWQLIKCKLNKPRVH